MRTYKSFSIDEYQGEESGWDKLADKYAGLLKPDTVYSLTKEMAHRIVEDHLNGRSGGHVLDFNCGSGNDFPYFLEKGWQISGCDGSGGMLAKCEEIYGDAISEGRIRLYLGDMEALDSRSFPGQQFDLIYSVTGGFSYVEDDEYIRTHEVLAGFLKPGGIIITAHLNRYCLIESLYHLSRFRVREGLKRWTSTLEVGIEGRNYRMYLRTPRQLRKLKISGLSPVRFRPLLAFTPPYQTGYSPSPGLFRLHRKLEGWGSKRSWLASFADQVVCIYRKA